MKVYSIFASIVCVLVIIMPEIFTSPTSRMSPVTHRHRHAESKVNAKRTATTLTELRDSISNLEQIERYYQHLLLRGYLSDDDVQRLERLQQFIQHLRSFLPNSES